MGRVHMHKAGLFARQRRPWDEHDAWGVASVPALRFFQPLERGWGQRIESLISLSPRLASRCTAAALQREQERRCQCATAAEAPIESLHSPVIANAYAWCYSMSVAAHGRSIQLQACNNKGKAPS